MNLKQIRQKQGITQAEMAEKLGVSRPTYIQIERGQRELTIGQAKVIFEILQMYKSKESEQEKLKEKIVLKNQSGKFNARKFEEVLLYVLEKVGAKPNIGETALFKLLYFIDFDFYEKHGQFITGATYMKNHHGPTPRQFKAVTDEMIGCGELERVRSKYFQYDQKKYLPRRKCDLNVLSAMEVEQIDDVLARLSDKNGSELRAYSHDDVPWVATNDQNDIDYDLVFQRTQPYSQRDHEMDFLDAAASDVLEHLPPLSEEEYDYYMNLPDKK
ncbi:DUF4065 domain-containing protein [Candidatus Peregrinibacteria bacterium]|nr:DUF4065 domain-containing protein [Candidatus Peregrinibacteria bacterium]